MDMETIRKSHQRRVQLLFFLRFIQCGSTAITGFITCYFIWWHDRLAIPTPRGFVVLLSACIYAFLENYITSAISVTSTRRQPNHRCLALTTGLSSVLLSFGYYELRQIPYVQAWCEGRNFAPVWENIEKAHCALVCDIIVAGAIALGFTWMITVFATVNFFLERKEGRLMLREAIANSIEDDECDEKEKGITGNTVENYEQNV